MRSLNADRVMPSTSYRSREQQIAVGIAGLIGSSFLAPMGLAVLAAPGGVVAGAVMVILGTAGYVLTYRAIRAGIRVSDCGVVIMNLTRSTELAWSDLERFSVGSHGMHSRIGIAHLRDGSSLPIWGVQGPNPLTRPGSSSAERQIDALNARLRDAKD